MSINDKNIVVVKANKYGFNVILDASVPYEQLRICVANKFRESADFFGDTSKVISFEGRVLDDAQVSDMINIITQNSKINIICVMDNDKKRENEYKKTLEEKINDMSNHTGQFYKGTLRSGQSIESEYSLVILGDVNPGAKVVSKGNIVILGSLRGSVYAGANGDEDSFVVALEMNPVQIRIGDAIARSDDSHKKVDYETMIAYVEKGNIYIGPLNKDVLNDIRFY